MSRQPERRRKRPDDELRKQQKEVERLWQALQDRRRRTRGENEGALRERASGPIVDSAVPRKTGPV
jgi:hypothetical protein